MTDTRRVRAWRASVQVFLKEGILDVQGRAVEQVLHDHGYAAVSELRVGKVIAFTVDASDRATAETAVRELAERLLANPLIETFQHAISSGGRPGPSIPPGGRPGPSEPAEPRPERRAPARGSRAPRAARERAGSRKGGG